MDQSTQPNKDDSNEEQILQIERQIAAALWVQAVAQMTEAILLSKLSRLREESEGERNILTGVWIQTIGQTMEAAAVTKELSSIDPVIVNETQKAIITADLLQAAGAALEAIGGKQVLTETPEGFIP